MARKQAGTGKTLAMKLLEGKGVAYEALSYPDHIRDAEQVAAYLQEPAGRVFKTLVALSAANKPVLAIIPAHKGLDLKKLALALQVKKARMASLRQAEEMTGLRAGGISPLALMNRGFKMLIDRSVEDQVQIVISAGRRGRQVKLEGADLVRLTGARVVELCD